MSDGPQVDSRVPLAWSYGSGDKPAPWVLLQPCHRAGEWVRQRNGSTSTSSPCASLLISSRNASSPRPRPARPGPGRRVLVTERNLPASFPACTCGGGRGERGHSGHCPESRATRPVWDLNFLMVTVQEPLPVKRPQYLSLSSLLSSSCLRAGWQRWDCTDKYPALVPHGCFLLPP